MACASPQRIFALRSSPGCQDVQQWLSLKFIIASPPPEACPEYYLRTAPATCALTLRLSRTCPPRCIKYPHIAHFRAPAHCLYHKHLYTAPRCNLLSRLSHSHQFTCTLPLSQAPSHSASPQLTFALTSPSHLFTV